MYTILFIPANFLVIKVLKKFNMQICLRMGSLLLIFAAWIRQIIQIDNRFYLWATIGNITGAFAQVFFLNCVSKLASIWFGDKERALSTAMGTLALPLGCIAGFVVPVTMIEEKDI